MRKIGFYGRKAILTLLGTMRINFLLFKRFIALVYRRSETLRIAWHFVMILLFIPTVVGAELARLVAEFRNISRGTKFQCILVKVGRWGFWHNDCILLRAVNKLQLDSLVTWLALRLPDNLLLNEDLSANLNGIDMRFWQERSAFYGLDNGVKFQVVPNLRYECLMRISCVSIALMRIVLMVEPPISRHQLKKNGVRMSTFRVLDAMQSDPSKRFEIVTFCLLLSQELKRKLVNLRPKFDQLILVLKNHLIGAAYFNKKAHL